MLAELGQEGYVGVWCPTFVAKVPGKGKGLRRHDAGLLLIE